jgi:tRNA modification GTPase
MKIRTDTEDTIAAIATPPGRGGVGILRISGPRAAAVASRIAPPLPRPRLAALRSLHDCDGAVLDQGLVLYFPGPASFTGEDVIEIQAHGSPVVLDELLAAVLDNGARHARAGEFSERAFLNGRLDLVQAEAVADLVEAGSRAAARAAYASLSGRFSDRVHALTDSLMRLRVECEARLDFAEEDIAALPETFPANLEELARDLGELVEAAGEGQRLTEGYVCVLSGAPNVGKSSLLNALAGTERAIVTEMPGTTRDLIEVDVVLGGVPVHLVDTAGLRESADPVESEGVRRARQRAAEADLVLAVVTADTPLPPVDSTERLLVLNKIDLGDIQEAGPCEYQGEAALALSAKTGAGLKELVAELSRRARSGHDVAGARFSARRRHIDALQRASRALHHARDMVVSGSELVAEDLAEAQQALGEVTGKVYTEDLLGAVFSTFCIGK